MKTAMMRISRQSQSLLKEMAAQEQSSMQAVLEKALEDYRRKRILEQINADYANWNQDPQYQAELVQLESTLCDGLAE